MMALKITKDNYDSVIANDKPVLIDFFATWCGPCKMMSPIIDKIAAEHPEYVVGKVDVDEEPELAKAFGVMSIPTLVVMKNGEVVKQNVGAIPEPAVLSMLENA
ncbi:MAG: thioredoxin [Clostridia bacterium]|nr:thioredoxin [Clostridia bacterium]